MNISKQITHFPTTIYALEHLINIDEYYIQLNIETTTNYLFEVIDLVAQGFFSKKMHGN